jgi:hypothetical protein
LGKFSTHFTTITEVIGEERFHVATRLVAITPRLLWAEVDIGYSFDHLANVTLGVISEHRAALTACLLYTESEH